MQNVRKKRDRTRKLRRSGLRPFSYFAPELIDPLFHKRGFVKGIIPKRWRQIVGNNLAQCCAPESLHFPYGKSHGAILKIVSLSGNALEIQYLSTQIIDKINSYLGCATVARIQIRQGVLLKSPKLHRSTLVTLEKSDKTAVHAQVTGIRDMNLRNHLRSLGEAIIARNKLTDDNKQDTYFD
ncbi:hypothetical protein P856_180 [Candidatus Endolissoclinum faulkneri L5]|uniref:DUF721 domain-containing protein n=1 Tax=Candidatus Endolissoclinum faulkneri L5 TaxID=1401328 RepID=V9TS56_9PROT|nr:DciA family protein [Candidatus Endolissoclinum faulkneri]AHC73416.1 hypothetical protein P856_180 [Candidatus Endolissoclinum faulkneri L5]